MTKPRRSSRCGPEEARSRLHTAAAYLETAELAHTESRGEFANVTAGLAVLAGIAASDAICCARLGERHRGDDHRSAVILLKEAVLDGPKLGNSLERLLGLKDTAHYGVNLIGRTDATQAIRWARRLVDRAREEVER